MKQLFLFMAIALTLASCNSTKILTDSTKKFLQDHNVQASITPNPATATTKFCASIDSLYNTEKIKAFAKQADVTFKVADGQIIIEGEAVGILDADKIAEFYVAVIKAISFWKK